ncbi:MAG: nucleoside recognition domain-containing protein [Syntrophomonadaceae bacterium]
MKEYSGLFFLSMVLIVALFMVIDPQETVTAAASGIQLWYTIVLPALFPFFIVAELLVGLKFVNFLGVILEPVMRPIFRLPGCSSLVVVMGFTSGFPVGALLTKKLYDEKMLTANEAERLVCFTNNSSPLFIIGAVGVGMFGSPLLGYLLAAAHYLSNLLLGFLLRFRSVQEIDFKSKPVTTWKGALHDLLNSYQDSGGIGMLLGKAIKTSITNILAIAGFIVVFSIITRMLSVWGAMNILANGIVNVLSCFDLSYPMAYGMGMGIFEMTLGARTITSCVPGEILAKLIIVSGIMAFSGLSVIAQIMSIVAGSPIRLYYYLCARLAQMALSISIVTTGYHFIRTSLPSMAIPFYKAVYSFDAWTFSIYCLVIGAIILLTMVIISLTRS